MKNFQDKRNDPIVAKIPFFYGWVIVAISTIAFILSSPAQTYGISVFNPFLRQELNLSHSQISAAYMLGTLFASLPMFFVGLMMDRYGLRRTMTVVVILFGIACIFMSQINSLITLFLAFLMLRMTGQGALGLLANNSVSMWFLRRLGKVTGAMNVIFSAAVSVIPVLFLWVIGVFNWRMSYIIFGVVIWVVMLSLMIFFRNRPEDIGQNVDGDAHESPKTVMNTNDGEDTSDGVRSALTLKQAVRTRAYWLLISMNAFWAMVFTAITFHLIPMFEFQGLTNEIAVRTFTTLSLSAAAMQLIGGFLADRYRLNILLVLSAFGFAVGLVMLILLRAAWMGHVYALVFGASQGLMGVVLGTVWVRYYGRQHLGKIRGTSTTAMVLGSSFGPFLVGYTFDQTASYTPSLSFFLFCSVIMLFALWFATPPRPQLVEK